MLRVLGSILLAAVVLPVQDGARPALRLKSGDVVLVTTPYGGEFTVQSDGAVYGRGFRAVLDGRTVEEAQKEMRRAMRTFVPEGDVFLSLKSVRQEVVYVVGLGGGRGPVPLTPGLTLRQLLASSELDGDADRLDVQVYRDGSRVASLNAASLLSGCSNDVELNANDIVALSPAPFVRVWVVGQVRSPGEVKVPVGSDVYKAVAAAGGFIAGADALATQPDEVIVSLRRGPDHFDLPLQQNGGEPLMLEAGDTISVSVPETRRVSVLGEVRNPGEYVLRGSTDLMSAIAAAGGPGALGSAKSVLVFRKGSHYQVSAMPGAPKFSLEQSDVVFVQRNESAYTVLGEVKGTGKFLFKDGEKVFVTDALAAAGGLAERGTMRRVYLARPQADGTVAVMRFHLDEFIKDGDPESNPEVLPGDTLLFGQPKGVTLSNVVQAISAALLIQTLTK
ncbi:MAG: SLBB domain-containing protein [Fimbriimonadaceae bacterium]